MFCFEKTAFTERAQKFPFWLIKLRLWCDSGVAYNVITALIIMF